MVDNGVPEPFARFIQEDSRAMEPDTIAEIRQKSHSTGYHIGG